METLNNTDKSKELRIIQRKMAMKKDRPCTKPEHLKRFKYEPKQYFEHDEDLESIHLKRIETKDMELIDILLGFGGIAVCNKENLSNSEYLNKYGQLWIGGEHNTLKIAGSLLDNLQYNNFDNSFRIAKGFALNNQGIWESHMWIVLRSKLTYMIVEDSMPKDLYFGYVLTDSQVEELFKTN